MRIFIRQISAYSSMRMRCGWCASPKTAAWPSLVQTHVHMREHLYSLLYLHILYRAYSLIVHRDHMTEHRTILHISHSFSHLLTLLKIYTWHMTSYCSETVSYITLGSIIFTNTNTVAAPPVYCSIHCHSNHRSCWTFPQPEIEQNTFNHMTHEHSITLEEMTKVFSWVEYTF